MTELPQEELNGLSARARNAHGQSDKILQEIVEVNPNAGRQESKQKKENKNEKL